MLRNLAGLDVERHGDSLAVAATENQHLWRRRLVVVVADLTPVGVRGTAGVGRRYRRGRQRQPGRRAEMTVIVKVTSDSPRAPLEHLPSPPLGLDVGGQTRAPVPQAAPAQAEGSNTWVTPSRSCSRRRPTCRPSPPTRHWPASTPSRHSLRTCNGWRTTILASPSSGTRSAGARSDRPIWVWWIGERRGNPLKMVFPGCHHARGVDRGRGVVPARRAPRPGRAPTRTSAVAARARSRRPMVNPDGHEHTGTQDLICGARTGG
ncbi:hypothetical protein HBB16_02375 [Pseudonocardia sp. MCCB 268]|nr:hypothetical protein [Pseudonocardia cytotoxica]